MFGRKPRLSSLAARKQLLIAESEVNRARLSQEWQALSGELGGLTERVQSFSKLTATATSLLMGLAVLRREASTPTEQKKSWLRKIIGGARLATAVWLARRVHRTESEKK